MAEYKNPQGKPESFMMHRERLVYEQRAVRRVLRIIGLYRDTVNPFTFTPLEGAEVALGDLLKYLRIEYENTEIDEQERIEACGE